MPTLYELTTVCGSTTLAPIIWWLVSVYVWCHAVRGLSVALWRSFLPRELFAMLWANPKLAEQMRRLAWELENRAHWTDPHEQRQVLTMPQPLSDSELLQRQRKLADLSRGSRLRRAASYLMQCDQCQLYWTSLALLLACSTAPILWQLLTAVAYAGAVGHLLPLTTPAKPKQTGGSCPSCSGR